MKSPSAVLGLAAVAVAASGLATPTDAQLLGGSNMMNPYGSSYGNGYYGGGGLISGAIEGTKHLGSDIVGRVENSVSALFHSSKDPRYNRNGYNGMNGYMNPGMLSSPLGMAGSPLGMAGSPLGMAGSPLGMAGSPLGMAGASPLGMAGSMPMAGNMGFHLAEASTDSAEMDDESDEVNNEYAQPTHTHEYHQQQPPAHTHSSGRSHGGLWHKLSSAIGSQVSVKVARSGDYNNNVGGAIARTGAVQMDGSGGWASTNDAEDEEEDMVDEEDDEEDEEDLEDELDSEEFAMMEEAIDEPATTDEASAEDPEAMDEGAAEDAPAPAAKRSRFARGKALARAGAAKAKSAATKARAAASRAKVHVRSAASKTKAAAKTGYAKAKVGAARIKAAHAALRGRTPVAAEDQVEAPAEDAVEAAWWYEDDVPTIDDASRSAPAPAEDDGSSENGDMDPSQEDPSAQDGGAMDPTPAPVAAPAAPSRHPHLTALKNGARRAASTVRPYASAAASAVKHGASAAAHKVGSAAHAGAAAVRAGAAKVRSKAHTAMTRVRAASAALRGHSVAAPAEPVEADQEAWAETEELEDYEDEMEDGEDTTDGTTRTAGQRLDAGIQAVRSRAHAIKQGISSTVSAYTPNLVKNQLAAARSRLSAAKTALHHTAGRFRGAAHAAHMAWKGASESAPAPAAPAPAPVTPVTDAPMDTPTDDGSNSDGQYWANVEEEEDLAAEDVQSLIQTIEQRL